MAIKVAGEGGGSQARVGEERWRMADEAAGCMVEINVERFAPMRAWGMVILNVTCAALVHLAVSSVLM